MQPWKKKKSLMRAPKITAVFEPMEREVLGDLTATVSEAIIERAQSAPKDELAEMLDMPTGHTEAPEDPSLARLFPELQRPGDGLGNRLGVDQRREVHEARALLEAAGELGRHMQGEPGLARASRAEQGHQAGAGHALLELGGLALTADDAMDRHGQPAEPGRQRRPGVPGDRRRDLGEGQRPVRRVHPAR